MKNFQLDRIQFSKSYQEVKWAFCISHTKLKRLIGHSFAEILYQSVNQFKCILSSRALQIFSMKCTTNFNLAENDFCYQE